MAETTTEKFTELRLTQAELGAVLAGLRRLYYFMNCTSPPYSQVTEADRQLGNIDDLQSHMTPALEPTDVHRLFHRLSEGTRVAEQADFNCTNVAMDPDSDDENDEDAYSAYDDEEDDLADDESYDDEDDFEDE